MPHSFTNIPVHAVFGMMLLRKNGVDFEERYIWRILPPASRAGRALATDTHGLRHGLSSSARFAG
jgi:hypothetical protein